MTTTPTPDEIEAFQKGLEDERLVPDGWLYEKAYGWRYLCEEGDRQPRTCSALDIQAMEGLAARELHLSEHGIRYHHDTGRWIFTNRGACVSWIERTESEHLPALVEAVRRVGG